jgi:hypothetical protein
MLRCNIALAAQGEDSQMSGAGRGEISELAQLFRE